ncbi:carboxymuconolactone decarboxylase family protein [Sedimenticola hydrogenitrophicus]|uniref:carboxymuconolactone decarboxylase family protein n=1 Tax=Sedimenticola hydrogenitrophicus TaxID=2967975 RepID=UPI0023B1B3D5|nr:carboxymuconolactone decarboxylase family protein [Sedimenticola hydrogenitrophicus]
MSRITPIPVEQTDAATAATLRAVQAKLGALPNMFTTFAHAPAALQGYLQLSEALAGGRLSARQRELVAIAVAQENGCEYCLSAHAALGKGAGLQEPAIRQAREGQAEDPLDAAILKLVLTITRNRGGISDGDLAAARATGLDDALVVEVISNIALNVMTNYLNRVAGTEVDFPRVTLSVAA